MLFVVFAIAVAYVVAVSILSKKTNAWNSFMGRLRYIKAIVVPDGQRRLLCTAAEIPIKLSRRKESEIQPFSRSNMMPGSFGSMDRDSMASCVHIDVHILLSVTSMLFQAVYIVVTDA